MDCLQCRATGAYTVRDMASFALFAGITYDPEDLVGLVRAFSSVDAATLKALARQGLVAFAGREGRDSVEIIEGGPFGREQWCRDCGLVVYENEKALREFWDAQPRLPPMPVMHELPPLGDSLLLRRFENERVAHVARNIKGSLLCRYYIEYFVGVCRDPDDDDAIRLTSRVALANARRYIGVLRASADDHSGGGGTDDSGVDDDFAREQLGLYDVVLDVEPVGSDLLWAAVRYLRKRMIRGPTIVN